MKKLSFLLSLTAILLLSSCCAFGTKSDKSEPANDSTANVTKAAITIYDINTHQPTTIQQNKMQTNYLVVL